MLTRMTTTAAAAAWLVESSSVAERATVEEMLSRALRDLGMLPLAVFVGKDGGAVLLYGVSAMFAAVRRLWVLGVVKMRDMDRYAEVLTDIPGVSSRSV